MVLLLIIPATVLRFDVVQHRLGVVISNKLKNDVQLPMKLGKIKFCFPNSLYLDSLLLKDLSDDTLAYIPRISAHFDIIPFIKSGDIKVNTLTLSAPDIRINRGSLQSPLNFQFLIDKFAKNDTTNNNNTEIHINQIQIYDGRLKYDILSESKKTKFDPSHVALYNMQANIALRTLSKDTLSLYIRRISFDEKSGFSLKRLKANINASENAIDVSRLLFEFPKGSFFSDNLRIKHSKEVPNPKFAFEGELKSNGFSLKDFIPFAPQLSYMESQPILKFETLFRGTENGLDINKLQVFSNNNILNIDLKGGVKKGLNRQLRYFLDISSFSVTSDFLPSLYSVITNGKNIPTTLHYLGNVSIDGTLDGAGKQFVTSLNIVSDAGMLNIDLDINKYGEYIGQILAKDVNIGKITDDNTWGNCGMNMTVTGHLSDSAEYQGNFNMTVSPLQYNQYSYSPIRTQGKFANNELEALVTLNDSNLQAHMSIEYDKRKKLPRTEISLHIDSFRPYNLGLTNKHENGMLSFRLFSELFGNDPEHSRMNVDIYDFVLKEPDNESKIHRFHISTNSLEQEKTFIVNSDFFNGYLTGYYNYKTLGNSFKLALQRVLPSFFAEKNILKTQNNFVFHFNINNTVAFSKIFDLPAIVKEHSVIQGSCNDIYNLFSIAGKLNGVETGKREYRYINFNSNIGEKSNKNKIEMVRKPIFDESKNYNPKNEITIEFLSDVHDDSLFTNFKWNNLYAPINKGNINIDLALERDNYNNLNVTAFLHDGKITQSDTLWNISPSTIQKSGEIINIDNFSLQSNNQYLRVNGRIGKNSNDKINIDLRHIDMEYVFDMIDFHPVNLGGEVSGNIRASSLLDDLHFNSDLLIDNLTFEHGLIGDLDLNCYWDKEVKSIILKGEAKEKDESRTIINGFVSPERDTLNIRIDAQKTRIDFLNHLLSDFICDAQGRVSGRLSILGAMRDINMQGALSPLGQIRIKPINSVYNLIGDTIHFTHNKIGFDGFHITDNHGNSGLVAGGVYHQSLKRFTCDFYINAHNLLAFNYPDYGEESFYGTAFVTGDANFCVNQSGTMLKANITTGKGSKFIYNASSPESNISNEFVTFVDRKKRKSPILNLDKFQHTELLDNINSRFNLDFMIDVTPEMQLRVYTNQASNDYIDIYGNGKVNAIYDEKRGFTMQGNLGLTRGTYKFTLQDIFPKEFDIRSGSSVAFNGDPFEAELNLKTVYAIPSVPLTDLSLDAEKRKNVKVNCFMDITGTIFKPNLAFNLELPDGNEEEKELLLSAISTPEQLNMQFLYLLGIGKFYTYDYNNQAEESQSSTAMESLISNSISGQLNNMLSQIIDNGNWNILSNFATSEKGWNSMEVEGILTGRLLDNRLLINGNLGYRDNPMANKKFIGDFEVQWLLNKSGNVSLKAYNKTNDRYFSKTTLTTQGAGILLKHDFDGWKFWKK